MLLLTETQILSFGLYSLSNSGGFSSTLGSSLAFYFLVVEHQMYVLLFEIYASESLQLRMLCSLTCPLLPPFPHQSAAVPLLLIYIPK